MRLVFFGTPEVAVPYLQRLAAQHEVLAVVTQPDRPRGRGRKLAPAPVKQEALRLGIPVLQPRRVRQERVCDLAPLRAAQATVVVAYGQILPEELCASAQRPALNVHYSLLPDLRGAAPVQRALLGGRQTTGVTVQYVAEELDSGDILLQQEVTIEPEDDAGALLAKLTEAGVPLLGRALSLLEAGLAPRLPQDAGRVTYAPPLRPEEAAVVWARSAWAISNQIRACSPQPGAFCHHQGVRLKLYAPAPAEGSDPGVVPGQIVELGPGGLRVQTGEGQVLIREVQPAGRRRMPAADYVRGARLAAGAILENG
jgi:methionyl-tRNA formyltransferase